MESVIAPVLQLQLLLYRLPVPRIKKRRGMRLVSKSLTESIKNEIPWAYT